MFNRNNITNTVVRDLEMIMICSNDEVFQYLEKTGSDIYDFIDLIDG